MSFGVGDSLVLLVGGLPNARCERESAITDQLCHRLGVCLPPLQLGQSWPPFGTHDGVSGPDSSDSDSLEEHDRLVHLDVSEAMSTRSSSRPGT